jgi:N-methylhydantoinase B/oxoprolinase/acetone carboxylase alpha subunit
MIFGTPSQVMYHARDGHVHQCSGIFGGYPGSTGYRHTVKNTDMKERFEKRLPYPVQDVDSENSQISANIKADQTRNRHMYHLPDPHKEYDVYLSQLCGGHGFGDLLERRPELVASDVNEGYLLERYAASHGAVGSANVDGKWAIDKSATEALRAEKRKARLDQRQSVEVWMTSQREGVADLDFIEPVKKMHRESCELSAKWLNNYREFWDLGENWQPPSARR